MNDLLTYRHPRTMDQAFPGGVDYACPITRSRGGAASIGRLVGQALAVLMLILMAAGVWSWTQTAPVESIELADATAQAQRQARFDKAARAMCAGRVAWIDTTLGVVQCGHSKKATAAKVAP